MYPVLYFSLDQSVLTAEYFEIDQAGLVKIKNSISAIGAGVTAAFYVLATDGGGNETRVTVTVVIAATTTTTATTTTDRSACQLLSSNISTVAWQLAAI